MSALSRINKLSTILNTTTVAMLLWNQDAWAQSAAAPAQSNTTAPISLPTSGQSTTANVSPTVSKPSSWHFQTTYGLSLADMETPYWNTAVDPVSAAQRSTTGVLTQVRYSHTVESSLGNSQAIRWGMALVNDQTAARNGVWASLAKESKAPEWRAWGVGTDIFLVRHLSPAVDFDAGLQADYLLSGVATLGSTDTVTSATQTNANNRLEQKSGWRLAFTGGIGGLYLGPLGMVMRLSGYVMQTSFKGHSQPLRAQGLQIQLGMDLALGRGDP